MVAYADRLGLDHGETEALVTIIGAMDSAFLDFHNKDSDAQTESG